MLRRKSSKSHGHIYDISVKRCKTDSNNFDAHDIRDNKFQVFHLIAVSHYLSIRELGRLLLITAKSIPAALFETTDDIWETICDSHFGKEVVMLLNFIPSDQKRSFISSLLEKDDIHFQSFNEIVVHPLKYAPSNYCLIINIYSKIDEKIVFSYTLSGSKVPQFFDNGSFTINDIALSIQLSNDTTIQDFTFSFHLVIVNTTTSTDEFEDMKCCCLFQSEKLLNETKEIHFISTESSSHVFTEMKDPDYVHSLMTEIDESADRISLSASFYACGDDDNGVCDGSYSKSNHEQDKDGHYGRKDGQDVVFTSLTIATEISSPDFYFTQSFPNNKNFKFAHLIEQLYA